MRLLQHAYGNSLTDDEQWHKLNASSKSRVKYEMKVWR